MKTINNYFEKYLTLGLGEREKRRVISECVSDIIKVKIIPTTIQIKKDKVYIHHSSIVTMLIREKEKEILNEIYKELPDCGILSLH